MGSSSCPRRTQEPQGGCHGVAVVPCRSRWREKPPSLAEVPKLAKTSSRTKFSVPTCQGGPTTSSVEWYRPLLQPLPLRLLRLTPGIRRDLPGQPPHHRHLVHDRYQGEDRRLHGRCRPTLVRGGKARPRGDLYATLPMQSAGFTPQRFGSVEPGSHGPKSPCRIRTAVFHKPKAPAVSDASLSEDMETCSRHS